MDSNRIPSKTIGALYMLAFLAYGGGNALVEPALNTSDYLKNVSLHRAQLTVGTILMSLVHSVIIVGIGVLLLPISEKTQPHRCLRLL